MYVQVKQSSDC